MDDSYNPDIVSVVDEDGKEHIFEELDRIETDKGKYVALVPAYDQAADLLNSSGELIILKAEEEDGEIYLSQIDDEAEFKEVGDLFEERLHEKFDIEFFEDEE